MLEKKSTCHDHRAVNDVNKHGGHLESTGIGATACIHGAFVPDSVIDFQKGEACVLISSGICLVILNPQKPEDHGLFDIQGSQL